MSEVAKHGGIVGHGVIPRPIVPPTPVVIDRLIDLDGGKTVFDGDDYAFFDASFDIEGAAARALAAYDRDNDGAIDLGSPTDGGVRIGETSRFGGGGISSIETLARHADEAGNGDGSATAEEIADVVRQFDQGTEGDGRLSGQERETFLEVFGEDVSRFHKAVRVPSFPVLPELPHPYHPFHRHPRDRDDILLGDHSPFDKLRTAAAAVPAGTTGP